METFTALTSGAGFMVRERHTRVEAPGYARPRDALATASPHPPPPSQPALLNSITMIIATELGAWRRRCASGRRARAPARTSHTSPLHPPTPTLGDKTFLIAAVMSMRYNRVVVFAGAIGALIVMSILSVGIGVAVPSVLSRTYTHYAAAILFAYFGFKLLKEAREMTVRGVGGRLPVSLSHGTLASHSARTKREDTRERAAPWPFLHSAFAAFAHPPPSGWRRPR